MSLIKKALRLAQRWAVRNRSPLKPATPLKLPATSKRKETNDMNITLNKTNLAFGRTRWNRRFIRRGGVLIVSFFGFMLIASQSNAKNTTTMNYITTASTASKTGGGGGGGTIHTHVVAAPVKGSSQANSSRGGGGGTIHVGG